MRRDRPSRTALKVALNLITLGSKPGMESILPSGIVEATAQLLVIQTMIGAGRMLRETGEEPVTLRQKVTTPGGTTQAAMDVMVGRGLPQTILDALRAACDRGPELDQS